MVKVKTRSLTKKEYKQKIRNMVLAKFEKKNDNTSQFVRTSVD